MIRIDSLIKSFAATRAVDALSLDIRPGEIFALLGPNGAGKSTTIAILQGLLTPDSGSVLIGDTPPRAPSDPRARALLGAAPQQLALYDQLTARENLHFFAAIHGIPRRGRADRADTLLRLVGLDDRAGKRLATFSGGMKRRINLACALVHDPRIILLDEPTAGVDPQSRAAILDIVRSLKDQGRTILYTTHYMEEAQKLCDRVAVIDHGRLLALGTVHDLIRAHAGQATVRVVREGVESRTQTPDPIGVIQSALAAGDVSSLHIEQPDLESVFLNLTGRSLRD